VCFFFNLDPDPQSSEMLDRSVCQCVTMHVNTKTGYLITLFTRKQNITIGTVQRVIFVLLPVDNSYRYISKDNYLLAQPFLPKAQQQSKTIGNTRPDYTA
jgi:hypothetical protein